MKKVKIMISLMLSIAFAMTMLGCEDAASATDFDIIGKDVAPAAPAFLHFTMTSKTSVTATWAAVVNAEKYEVEIIVNGNRIRLFSRMSASDERISNLAENDLLTVSVRAISNGTDGDTQIGPAISKSLKMANPEISGLTFKDSTAGTITLGWDAAANSSLKYSYTYKIVSRAPGDGIEGTGVFRTATEGVIPNLAPNKTYSIVVTAQNEDFNSPPGNGIFFYGISNKMTVQGITAATMDKPELTFESPAIADPGGITVNWNPIDGATHYNIYYGESATKGKINISQIANSNSIQSYMFFGNVGRTYHVWIEALNSDTGAVSDAGTGFTLSGAVSAPLIKPVLIERAEKTNTEFTVQWDASYSNASYYTLMQLSNVKPEGFNDILTNTGGVLYTGGLGVATASLSASGAAATPNTTYHVWVKMIIGDKQVFSDPITVTTANVN